MERAEWGRLGPSGAVAGHITECGYTRGNRDDCASERARQIIHVQDNRPGNHT
jgi:hypothetical protein